MAVASGETLRIAGAVGYWGESDQALPQFLAAGGIDYVVFDYLAEITMSILARAQAADPSLGYATDFVTAVVKPHLAAIKSAGIRLISNAGGINPEGCASAIRALAADAGIAINVAVVTGDNLLPKLDALASEAPAEMFSGAPFPPREAIASANAYLGAFPIAEALATGADIVITGRCVDSAVTLGACIHAFGWTPDDQDLLAAGSLVGHLIECGPQVTGGNFTDWSAVADSLWRVGYPVAEINADGTAVITKPSGTGGIVNVGTVGEQLLYEIADPSAYWLPDVICDFSQVHLEQVGDDRVSVRGALGRGIPRDYKVSLTWMDGWRGGAIFFYVGVDAASKARLFAGGALQRAEQKLAAAGLSPYADVAVEVVGDESHYGVAARAKSSREVAVKVACRHRDKQAVSLLLRELSGFALGSPAGLCGFAGTRPKPSPVVRLFSTRVDKAGVDFTVHTETRQWSAGAEPGTVQCLEGRCPPIPDLPATAGPLVEVPLQRLAWARSGDKGDKANIGVMARRSGYLPWIAAALSVDNLRQLFAHFMTSPALDRYYLPGLAAINIVLHETLGGGGVASLRNDPQAKSYAQILLDCPIAVPTALLED